VIAACFGRHQGTAYYGRKPPPLLTFTVPDRCVEIGHPFNSVVARQSDEGWDDILISDPLLERQIFGESGVYD
jgi:hypothetical protein